MSLTANVSASLDVKDISSSDLFDFDVDFDFDIGETDSLDSALLAANNFLEVSSSSGSNSPNTPSWDTTVEGIEDADAPPAKKKRIRAPKPRAERLLPPPKRTVDDFTIQLIRGSAKHQNQSRSKYDSRFYAFPVYDKCDSLVYFPYSFSRALNTGDSDLLTKLVRTYFHKDCVCMIKGQQLNNSRYLVFSEIMSESHPDYVSCVYSTKVVDNEIHAVMYTKFTNNVEIRNSLARSITDPTFKAWFQSPREHYVKKKFDEDVLNAMDLDSQERMDVALRSNKDIVIQGKHTIMLRFDPVTKKINYFESDARITSAEVSTSYPSA